MNVPPAVFDPLLSDTGVPTDGITLQEAERLYIFLKQHPLFNWNDTNNGCEGRCDAACVLLDEWRIPNYKAWIFGGAYLKKTGGLKQNWNYHTAPVLPVKQDEQIVQYVLDPSTGGTLQRIDEWAAGITQFPQSYYAIRQSHWYIFPAGNIYTSKWNQRNRQNRKWMIQGLSGVHALTGSGKSRLVFNKARLKNTKAAFEKAKKQRVTL